MSDFITSWYYASRGIILNYILYAGVAYLVLYVAFKNQFMQKKIQKRFPQWSIIKFEIFHSCLTAMIFGAVAIITLKYLHPYTNIFTDKNEYGLVYYYLTLPLMFVIHDAYFYWTHRLMHIPVIYKYIHKTHHVSINPTPFSSYSFHPVEAVVESGIILVIAFTLPVSPSALLFFLFCQFLYNVYGHSGYEIMPKKIHKTWLGKWVNTSFAHNMHHRHFSKNYGLYFLFWDRVMGTLHDKYDERFAVARKKSTPDLKAYSVDN
ncbi:MAG: sterol desaturase family protein [Aquaticitalea sp.]